MKDWLLIGVLALLLCILGEVHDVKRLLADTQLEARTASTLVRYWLPPMAGDRVSCRRCHK